MYYDSCFILAFTSIGAIVNIMSEQASACRSDWDLNVDGKLVRGAMTFLDYAEHETGHSRFQFYAKRDADNAIIKMNGHTFGKTLNGACVFRVIYPDGSRRIVEHNYDIAHNGRMHGDSHVLTISVDGSEARTLETWVHQGKSLNFCTNSAPMERSTTGGKSLLNVFATELPELPRPVIAFGGNTFAITYHCS